MSDGIYKKFYSTKRWQQCREAYKKSKGYLCERCLANGIVRPATEVHHKIRLTPSNIYDESITLNWANLMCVCEQCHDELHGRAKRYTVDEYGRVCPPSRNSGR